MQAILFCDYFVHLEKDNDEISKNCYNIANGGIA